MKNKKDYKSKNFLNTGEYKVTTLKPKSVPFAKLYMSKNIPLKYIIAALAGMIFAILSLFLLKNTGGFSYGLGALLQGVSRFISFLVYKSGNVATRTCKLIYSLLFWGLLLVVNIPLFIFSWKKIGHRFTLLSLTFIVVDVGFGFALDQIPNINSIYILGDTCLYTDATHNPVWITQIRELGVQIIPFSVPNALVDTYHASNYIKSFLLILNGIVYAVVAGIVFALLYIVGGCTTGADFVSTYLSTKKQKDVAGVFLIVNIICVTVGVILGCYVPALMINKVCANYQFFFSANFISTLISLCIFTFMFKLFYPRNKKFRVEVFSQKALQIKKFLYKNNYVHASSLDKVIGGYSNKTKDRFMTICSTMELPMLIDQINTIDKESIIDITQIAFLTGKFANQQLGSDGAK